MTDPNRLTTPDPALAPPRTRTRDETMAAADIAKERAALVSTLEQVGPNAPTLAGDWSTTELAQHLAAQDRMRGVPASLARRFVMATNIRVTAAYLNRPRAAAVVNAGPTGWEASLRRLHYPPATSLVRHPVATVTLWEHFVHHEDVRRPAGLPPQRSTPDMAAVIRWLLRYNGPRLRGETIRVLTPDGNDWSTGAEATLTIHGRPGELVLWLSGRGHSAEVQYQGDPQLFATMTHRMSI